MGPEQEALTDWSEGLLEQISDMLLDVVLKTEPLITDVSARSIVVEMVEPSDQGTEGFLDGRWNSSQETVFAQPKKQTDLDGRSSGPLKN